MENRKKFERVIGDMVEFMYSRHRDFCFYLYGSYLNGHPDHDPSDIDGGVISPTLITDKDAVLDISRRLDELQRMHDISPRQVQFNLLDVVSARDGRFLAYTSDFTDHIKAKGAVLSGPENYLEELNGAVVRFGPLYSAAFNFRAMRNSALNFVSSQRDERQSQRDWEKMVDDLRILPRKILTLEIIREHGGRGWQPTLDDFLARFTKRKALEVLRGQMPELEFSVYDRLGVYPATMEDREKIWRDALTLYECVVKSFIDRHPPIEIDVKTAI